MPHNPQIVINVPTQSSFAPAFFFLDKRQRAALSAYYGFARAADDIADDPCAPVEEKRARLAAWRGGVEGLFSGDVPDTPLARDLARAIEAFPLKREHFLRVLDGVEMDLEPGPFPSFADLETYMSRVAGAVGLACLAVFRYEDEAAPALAERLGAAVQLTNIIRDAAEDHAAGRVYLPQEDLARFGCRPEDLGGSNYPPNFIELMQFEAERARGFYAGALALAAPGQKRRLVPALVMGALYRALLEKIERGGFRVKEGRARLSRAEKLKALYQAWQDYRRI
ncbi:MAG: squalene/phytoene synthase family protein [Elusimicrobiales bacterium]|nr:squalene/phytoene synthase family protein [Elusimicrobiales bacterium]